MRLGLKAVVIAAASVVVAGCIETDAQFEVNKDATVDGTMVVQMATDLAQMFGIDSREAFEKQLLDPDSSDIPAGQSFTVTEEDGKYKMTITYDNTPLVDDAMKIEVTSDNRLKFTYKNDGMGEGEMGASLGQSDSMKGSIKFQLRFPGEVVETVPSQLPPSVKVDGNEVRINSDLNESLDLEIYSMRDGESGGNDGSGEPLGITSSDNDKNSSNAFGIGIGIAIAVVALVAVAYMVVRRRSSDMVGPDNL
jgi:hypothetical protein